LPQLPGGKEFQYRIPFLPWAKGTLTIRGIALHAALFLAYIVLFRASYIFQTSDLRSTPWNPETGIAVVAGALLGWASLPAIFLASLVSKTLNPTILSFGWEVVAAAVNAMVFAGSAAKLVMHALGNSKTTKAEIEEIKNYLNEMERKMK
jgi:hypothetical protein